MPVQTYQKKADVSEAIQYDGTNQDEIIAWCPIAKKQGQKFVLHMPGFGAPIEVPVNAWVVKDIAGMFTPFAAEAFLLYYEPV
jgi:hypothetical protein